MFALNRAQAETSRRTLFWVSALSGLLSALPFTVPGAHDLIWVSLVPWLALFFRHGQGAKRGAFLGFAFGLPFCLGSLFFFTALHPLTWRGMDMLTSIAVAYGLAWGGLSLMLSVGFVLFGLVLGLLAPTGWGRIVFAPLLWILLEWSQRLGMMALPWLPLSLTQVNHPAVLQIAGIGGSPLVAAVIVLVNAGIAALLLDLGGREPGTRIRQLPGLGHLLAAIGVLGVTLGYGNWRLAQPMPAKTVKVAVVQGNVRPDVKWQPGSLDTILYEHQRLSRLASQAKPDLIVWAESAIPLMLDETPPVVGTLRDLAKELQTPLLIGSFDRAAKGYYNGAALMNADGRWGGWYYKRHLVPFGEFLPYRNLLEKLPGLAQINALGVDVIPGETPALLDIPEGRMGTLICFESIFPEVVRESVLAGADWLTIITNDAWYKDTQALDQHNAQAAVRAVENGRSVIRCANTGISSLIDPRGHILQQSGKQVDAVLTGQLPVGGETTPYVRWGEWPVPVAAGVLAAALLRRRKRRHVAAS